MFKLGTGSNTKFNIQLFRQIAIPLFRISVEFATMDLVFKQYSMLSGWQHVMYCPVVPTSHLCPAYNTGRAVNV